MNNRIIFYLAPLVNKWLVKKYHGGTPKSLKYFIKEELGKDWLNRLHVVCLRLDKQVTRNQIVKEISKVQEFYTYLELGNDIDY